MRKETIAAAIVFFVLGFLAGYVYDAQQNWRAQQRAASGAGMGEQIHGGTGVADSTAGAIPPQLPEGHPSIDAAAIIKTLQEQAAKDPQDPEPRLKLANHFYDQHQYPQAVEWYQKALELDPKNANAHTDLGTTYFYLGRAQDALREYSRLEILYAYPTWQAGALLQAGKCQQLLGKATEAAELYHRIVKTYPKTTFADEASQRLKGIEKATVGKK